MRIFIQFVDFKLWLMIKNKPNIQKNVVNGEEVEDFKDKLDDQNMKKIEQNEKAKKKIYYYAINLDDFTKISRYKIATKMWDKLEVT